MSYTTTAVFDKMCPTCHKPIDDSQDVVYVTDAIAYSLERHDIEELELDYEDMETMMCTTLEESEYRVTAYHKTCFDEALSHD